MKAEEKEKRVIVNIDRKVREEVRKKARKEILRKYPLSTFGDKDVTLSVLNNFGLIYLNKSDAKLLNNEALTEWMKTTESIYMSFNIKKIIDLIPEKVKNDLSVKGVKKLNHIVYVGRRFFPGESIQELKNLKEVAILNLKNCELIQELPKLEIATSLILEGSGVKSLPLLKVVYTSLILSYTKVDCLPSLVEVNNGNIVLGDSPISSLPNLEKVSGKIYVLEEKIDYWKNYFNETGRPHLADKVEK